MRVRKRLHLLAAVPVVMVSLPVLVLWGVPLITLGLILGLESLLDRLACALCWVLDRQEGLIRKLRR